MTPWLGKRIFRLCFLVLCGALLTSSCQADDRALLIGIGDYLHLNDQLEGIDQDMRLMRRLVQQLGFRPHQVRELEGPRATLAGVEEALGELVTKAGPEDRVLIYFSGHGGRVIDRDGDELDDQADEVLMLYDTHVVHDADGADLENVLLDDHFGDWLRRIRSRHIIVLVDACHSGSPTESLSAEDRGAEGGKFFVYPGMPLAGKGDFLGESVSAASGQESGMLAASAFERQLFAGLARLDADRSPGAPELDEIYIESYSNSGYAALSAAGDHQVALPSLHGSYFTRALSQTAEWAAAQRQPITLRQLRDAAEVYIRQQLPRGQWYTPTLSGSSVIADIPLKFD